MSNLFLDLEYDQVEHVVVESLKQAYLDSVYCGETDMNLLMSLLTVIKFYLPESEHEGVINQLLIDSDGLGLEE